MSFGPITTAPNPSDIMRGRTTPHGMRQPTFEEQYDAMIRNKEMREKGKEMIGKGLRKAGDALRTAFGGGAITGESSDRRMPTEQMVIEQVWHNQYKIKTLQRIINQSWEHVIQ
jgi:hypothetical protein